jgi:uncharacterized membrane protein YcfT
LRRALRGATLLVLGLLSSALAYGVVEEGYAFVLPILLAGVAFSANLRRIIHWSLRGTALLCQILFIVGLAKLSFDVTFFAEGGRTGWQEMGVMEWALTWGLLAASALATVSAMLEWALSGRQGPGAPPR